GGDAVQEVLYFNRESPHRNYGAGQLHPPGETAITGQERRRFWLGLSDTPELDSAGRILINPVLREGAGISREVMLLGVGSHFELWDPERLSRHKEQVRARKFRGGRD
ncbi:MAG: hypothetical protein ACO3WO_03550, partial [Burkholderiaceae bacterium]